MAHVLRLTDGTTTITFTSGDMYLADYVPRSAIDLYSPLQERATVGFITSTALIQSNLAIVNRLFQQALNYAENKSGPKVYVEFDPGTSGTAYRSLLYSGEIELPDDTLGVGWGTASIEAVLTWVRDPFWEGALTQIPLSNGSDTDNTAGITVDNRDDSDGDNWVSISSSDVGGDLPALMKLQLYNATTDSTAQDEIYVFHNVYSAPASFVHIIEGESAVNSTDTVTSTTDATCSADAYAVITWSSTSETKIAEWTLSSSDLSDAAGGRFSVLARWNGQFVYDDCWLRLKLETTVNYDDLWEGNLSLVSSTTDGDELSNLDTLRLPPSLPGQTTIKELALRLYGLRGTAGTTINLDYLQLSPISSSSGWLRFKSVGKGVPAEQTFIHDPIEDLTYYKDASGNFIAEWAQYGGPIQLIPNAAQKLYFLTSDNTGSAKTSQQWTVKLWYRPRRSSI